MLYTAFSYSPEKHQLLLSQCGAVPLLDTEEGESSIVPFTDMRPLDLEGKEQVKQHLATHPECVGIFKRGEEPPLALMITKFDVFNRYVDEQSMNRKWSRAKKYHFLLVSVLNL